MGKLVPDSSLDQVIGVAIHMRGCLVKEQDLRGPEEGKERGKMRKKREKGREKSLEMNAERKNK